MRFCCLQQKTKELAQVFSDFFIDKIASHTQSVSHAVNVEISHHSAENCLVEFNPTSQEEVKRIIQLSPSKSCELDPIPTWLLKDCLNELLPILTKIINTSLETAKVPKSFKSSHIRPLLKKPGLDQNTLKN